MCSLNCGKLQAQLETTTRNVTSLSLETLKGPQVYLRCISHFTDLNFSQAFSTPVNPAAPMFLQNDPLTLAPLASGFGMGCRHAGNVGVAICNKAGLCGKRCYGVEKKDTVTM